MSNTKHTPGPWVERGHLVLGQDGHVVVMTSAGMRKQDEWVANAKLIAAAPDLLEICKRINASEPLPKDIQDELDYAIKKATE